MKSLRFRIKTIAGILLVTLSAAGIFYWESAGRELVMMTPVLVSARDIEEGEMILPEDLAVLSLPFDAVVTGALRPGEKKAQGMLAKDLIPARQQIVASMLRTEDSLFSPGETVFCLESEWIYSRPASLCSGDVLSVYRPDGELLGNYRAAYLRNGNEQPINAPRRGDSLLDRGSDGIIEDIEIVCTAEDYFAILESIRAHEEKLIAGGSYISADLKRCLIICVAAEDAI